MTYSLPQLRHAIGWLSEIADLHNVGDAAAAEVLAGVLADALQAYHETAQAAADLAVAAGVARFELELEGFLLD
jgi:hypothetical protein